MPASAYSYALPERLRRRHRIRRYGFHGPSQYFVSRRLYDISGIRRDDSRVISCYLGNGASMCAIRNGESVDTSMGLTPLSGLVMGTRCGDVDASVVFERVEKDELPLSEVHTLLNRHSGLLGLSGYASDMRDLLEEAAAASRCGLSPPTRNWLSPGMRCRLQSDRNRRLPKRVPAGPFDVVVRDRDCVLTLAPR